MINTNIITIPAYVVREFRNFGLYNKDTLYDYKFTIQELSLLNSGAIRLIPNNMCKFYTPREVILNGEKYTANQEVDSKAFVNKSLYTLLKTGIISCEIAEEFKSLNDKEIIELASLYDCVGNTFKEVASKLNLDFDKIKETFELKKGANNKKVKLTDLDKLKELVLEV